MKPDLGLEPTRQIREEISKEFDNDPRKLVEHYLNFQKTFEGRLRYAPSFEKKQSDTEPPIQPAQNRGQ